MHREPCIEHDPIELSTEEGSDVPYDRSNEECWYNTIPIFWTILGLVPGLVKEDDEESDYTTSKRQTVVVGDEKLLQKSENIPSIKEIYEEKLLRTPIRENRENTTK